MGRWYRDYIIGNYKKAFANEELRFYFKVIVLAGLFIMVILLLKTNKPVEEAFRCSFFYVVSIATALAGIGPGIGSVGPVANFAHLHDFSKAVMSLAMFIGRLELLTFFALFTPAFWRY